VSAGRILVVDDDPQIRRVMRVTLTAQGYEVSDAKSGEEALERLHYENYDLVLLDVNMSGMGGIKVCRTLRCGRHGFELAIIMLTVLDTEKDKVDALDAGANDNVTKPFSISELLARIRAALRRVPIDPGLELQRIKLENVEIDFSSRRVTGPGRDVRLTPKEFDLLALLAANAGRAVTRDRIMSEVWDSDWYGSTKTLDMHISNLRKKLAGATVRITTLRHVGYRLDV
jgi:DNA-binding response OmpR family regulator